MKKALAALLALGGACALSAGSPGTASADVVAIKTIPVAKLINSFDMPRDKAPDKIPASEKVEGFFPAAPPQDQQKRVKERGGYQYWGMYSTDAEAKRYTQSGWGGQHEQDGPRTCFTQGWSHSDHLEFYQYVPPPPAKPGSKEWVAEQKRKAERGIKPGTKQTPPPKPNTVRGIRAERFVIGADDKATLEMVDAWFDYTELGVRETAKSSVPFAKIASGPNGLTIYAARDEKQVTFIVTPPKAPELEGPNPQSLRNMANRLFAQLPGSGSTSSTECGYLRMSLTTGPGTGQMASVLATAFLPTSVEDAADLPSNKTDPDADESEEKRAADQRKRIVRTRPMMANLSISQLANEPDPLVSISFAWAGKDQQQRF
jgi:hypothetical protein